MCIKTKIDKKNVYIKWAFLIHVGSTFIYNIEQRVSIDVFSSAYIQTKWFAPTL